MNRTVVESSNLKSVAFENGVFEVEFRSGKIYQFKGVPQDVFEGLMKAPSKGKFFNNYIKPHYTAEKILETIRE